MYFDFLFIYLKLNEYNLSLSIFRDIAKYNTDDDLEESMEETGWKLVHGDVFRTPNNNRLFASIIGSGVQIFCMMAITIFFAMLGMSFSFLRIFFQAPKETIFHITFKMLIFWRLEVGGLFSWKSKA